MAAMREGERSEQGQSNGHLNGDAGQKDPDAATNPKHIGKLVCLIFTYSMIVWYIDMTLFLVSDDMLYKLSKKIAQLTKVIYSLNTKNDDLELDLEVLRSGYEEKLQKVSP